MVSTGRAVEVYVPEISLEFSEDVGVGAILGGVNNHIKALWSTRLRIKGVC